MLSDASAEPDLSGTTDAGVTIAVSLDGVSVQYRVPRERISSFKHYAIRWLKRDIVFESFWALREVSFDVNRGEVFGRIAPLLESSAAFNLELTGRENVFLYSAVLGHRRADTASRLDRIVAFAGLEQFIDAPLRTYSTGMVARLGFAVATDVRPDILIVDEVLSVGDAEFQKKSTGRMEQFRASGTTILMVSHDLDAVTRLCSRAAWLEHGHLRGVGPVADVVAGYTAASVA